MHRRRAHGGTGLGWPLSQNSRLMGGVSVESEVGRERIPLIPRGWATIEARLLRTPAAADRGVVAY
jgi:signal transduction histidine kinase